LLARLVPTRRHYLLPQRAPCAAAALFVHCIVAAPAAAQLVNPANGHAYYASTCPRTHAAARAFALAKGGSLVRIDDAAEQTWLLTAFGTTEEFWIGLTDESIEGQWRWEDGTPAIYQNWSAGQPSNGVDADAVVMNAAPGGAWRVAAAGELHRALVEAAVAPAIRLHWPLAGRPGVDSSGCHFFDHAAGSATEIYLCLPWATNAGTSIVLEEPRGFAAMDAGGPAVFAAAPGVVTFVADEYIDRRTDCSYPDPPAGNTVIIDHGAGLITQYSHLEVGSVQVSPGMTVAAGRQLARLGSSGCSTGPRLAFDIRLNGGAVDPFLGVCHQSSPLIWDRQPDFALSQIAATASLSDDSLDPAAPPRYYFAPQHDHVAIRATLQQAAVIGTQARIEWIQNGTLYAERELPPIVAPICRKEIFESAARPLEAGPGEVRVFVDGVLSWRQPYLGISQSPPPAALPTAAQIRFAVPPRAGVPAVVDVIAPAVDPDGAMVRYRYEWLVNGQPVRTHTSVALSDLLAAGLFAAGATVQCGVTPGDGVGEGPTVSVAAVALSPPPVDTDGDAVEDGCDNCPQSGNASQADADSDGVGDSCDGCPADSAKTHPGACGCHHPETPGCVTPCPDGDGDGDGVCDAADQCPGENDLANADGDAQPDCLDGCPTDANKTVPGVCDCGTSDTNSDSDLAPDCIDGCPMDAGKIAPGLCGCGVADTDSDGDTVPNCHDACPNDPLKTSPGACGCGQPDTPACSGCPDGDADGDGVCDSLDLCPGANDHVDADSDGLPDCMDGCPQDGAKTSPGHCGCGVAETDSDGDNAPDCIDGCPFDPAKLAPGICGCGTPETDSDGDGAANCIDGCPFNPTKLAPGICGCDAADSDSDGDGVANCIDGCPGDSAKTSPGLCGCGVAETDPDGDSAPNCIDGCPLDPAKLAPGDCGCGRPELPGCPFCPEGDDDHDGVCNSGDACPGQNDQQNSDGDLLPDCLDGCPFDELKNSPGACGCGVPDTDADGDGTLNCFDGCPADGGKVDPGACGCGKPETPGCASGAACPEGDADGDGICNSADGCPNNASRAAPGPCGCDVAESDGDLDGVVDCVDGCPFDRLKSAPGSCGCGVTERDFDADGVVDCLDNCPAIANPDQADADGDGVGGACEVVESAAPAPSPLGPLSGDVTATRPGSACGFGLCGAGTQSLLAVAAATLMRWRRGRRWRRCRY